MEDVHYGEKGIEEQTEGVHVCKREKGGDSYCNLILNSHEEMCGITSARGSGSCEQEATQKQRRRVTFLSLNWSLLSQLEYGNEAEAVFGGQC